MSDWIDSSDWVPRDGRLVKVSVALRLNATGEVRNFEDSLVLESGDSAPNDYLWRDGNYSCDCNRALFFARAAGEDEPDIDCSDGLYSVCLSNPVSGVVFYDEFGGPTHD